MDLIFDRKQVHSKSSIQNLSAVFEMIAPKNELLKNCIRYIYRFSADDNNFKRQLIIFPNTGAALVLYKDTDFSLEKEQRFLSVEKKGNSGIMLHLNRIDPVIIKEEGKQNRIGIVLKPLGINYFIEESVAELLKRHDPSLIPASTIFTELAEFAKSTQMEQSLESNLSILEELLLKRYHPFENSILQNSIDEIEKSDQLLKIEEIALRVGTSGKTMERLFRKHIGLNPVEFRKITQFRNALKNRLTNPDASFKDIAWGNSYHDLPYMIRVFKEMTGINMKEFFSKLSYSADMQYVFVS